MESPDTKTLGYHREWAEWRMPGGELTVRHSGHNSVAVTAEAADGRGAQIYISRRGALALHDWLAQWLEWTGAANELDA